MILVLVPLHSTQEERDTYHSWQNADQKDKCIIFESLDNVLRKQYVFISMTCDIVFSLQEMFDDKGSSIRQVILKTLMNIRIPEGTSIRDHNLRDLVGFFQVVQVQLYYE